MNRTIGILQPGYLPWLGFFEQVYRSQLFVIYDDVQYDKHSWRNRNRIKTSQGAQWLTVPVLTSGKNRPLVKDVEIDNSINWPVKHCASIRQNYSKSTYFDQYFPVLDSVYVRTWKYLVDLNMALLFHLLEFLGLTTEIRFSSSLNIVGESTERLVRICTHLDATAFYEGAAGRDYIDVSLFSAQGIEVLYQDYHHPTYHQLHGDFIPYLSVIDLLFNHGQDSLAILTGRKGATTTKENVS